MRLVLLSAVVSAIFSAGVDECRSDKIKIVNEEEDVGGLFPKATLGPSKNRKEFAELYLNRAINAQEEEGKGEEGWLNLVSAYEFAPEDDFIKESLLENYIKAGHLKLAREISAEVIDMPEATTIPYVAPVQKFSKASEVLVPFSTLVGRWSLEFSEKERACVYQASVALWQKLEKHYSNHTEVNHALFQYQMKILRESGKYATELSSCPLWNKLQAHARSAATELLRLHGAKDPTKAHRSDMLIWTSVHSASSYHQAHNTADSLIGGVYYISVPPYSGKLSLLDPRGTSPGHRDSNLPPRPPFTSTVELAPKEDLLVLFPGYLVHSVLPAHQPSSLHPAHDATHPNKEQNYNQPTVNDQFPFRVSVSVNLKGEWFDTSHLSFVLPPDLDLYQ